MQEALVAGVDHIELDKPFFKYSFDIGISDNEASSPKVFNRQGNLLGGEQDKGH